MGKSPRIANRQKSLELFALGVSEDAGDIYRQHSTAASYRRATVDAKRALAPCGPGEMRCIPDDIEHYEVR